MITIVNLLISLTFSNKNCSVLAGVKLQTEESKLRKQWPENYDKDIRPAINASRPVRVIFGVAIGQIVEVVRMMISTSVVKLIIESSH